MVKVNTEELLTYLILIIIGYFIAKMFSGMCSCRNGFSVGGIPTKPRVTPRQCEVVFEEQCGKARNCMICAGLNQQHLRAAGCTNADLQKLCNGGDAGQTL